MANEINANEIKAMIEKVLDKAKNDPDFANKFKKDPEKAIESVIGIDIPDGIVDQVIKTVKGKMDLNTISSVMNMFKK